MSLAAAVLDAVCRPLVWLHDKSRTRRIWLRARIPRGARVLEIGSGGRPWFRSDVLCDKYLHDNVERSDRPLVRDRPFVQADGANLPFEDDSFDFVYCSHVAEHVNDLGAFLQEIQRVGRAGYIETPNALFEQTVGTATHAWALWAEGGVLHAEPKWVPGAPPRAYHGMHAVLARRPFVRLAWQLVPELQPMCFFWRGSFKFVLHETPRPVPAERASA